MFNTIIFCERVVGIVSLVSNSLKLVDTVVRMIDKRRSGKTSRKILKTIKKINRMSRLPYEERIDSELDIAYLELNELLLSLDKENESSQI
jgi:hypothetical protein